MLKDPEYGLKGPEYELGAQTKPDELMPAFVSAPLLFLTLPQLPTMISGILSHQGGKERN